MPPPNHRLIPRRGVAVGGLWTVPVILAVATTPAYAASCPLVVTIATSGLGANGVDLYIRDSKNTNNATNTSTTTTVVNTNYNNPIVNMAILVTDCTGAPVAGATVVVASDHQRDLEGAGGGELVGFTPATQTSGFGEAPGNRVATVTTDASGIARVKICTATFSAADRGSVPRNGTWSIAASATGFVPTTLGLTYQVFDGQPLI